MNINWRSRLATQLSTVVAGCALADLCVVDLDTHWQVSEQTLVSQGKHTPFLGMELPARVVLTMVAGQVVHEAAR